MRVVWKDTVENKKTYQTKKYRNIEISWHVEDRLKGWIVDLEDDNNVYKSFDNARNAIDAVLGGMPRRTCGNRQSKGIVIIGTKEPSI